MMSFQHNAVNFELRNQKAQNMFLKLFEFIVTIICDIKIDLIMSEPHYVKVQGTNKVNSLLMSQEIIHRLCIQ